MPEWNIILLNIYYLGVAIAFLVKDILTLRIIMIIAGLCMIVQGFLSENKIVIFWLSLFTIINTFQVIRILYENRGIRLIKNIEELYKKIFYDMSKREFQRLWLKGEIVTVDEKTTLCHDGNTTDKILFIINGSCVVRKHNDTIAALERGNFIAEMGFLTGKPASADVVAETTVTYIFWTHKKLLRFKEVYPNIYNKFHLILSKDLTEKLKKYL